MTKREPFRSPFPAADTDRTEIWEMLVTRDIEAFVSADWSAVAGDFIPENFTGISGHFQADPNKYDLAYPTLEAYRVDWLKQANDFAVGRDAGVYEGDPRDGIFKATRLEDIEIADGTALVRKKFDGYLARTDGPDERMNWQTLYWCRRHDGRWKISGFIGYLPHIKHAQ